MKKKRLIPAAALAAATLTMGCAEPQCSATRVGELSSHWQSALEHLVDLEPAAAAESLAVGIGIRPHPSVAVAGAMPLVVPRARPPKP